MSLLAYYVEGYLVIIEGEMGKGKAVEGGVKQQVTTVRAEQVVMCVCMDEVHLEYELVANRSMAASH